MWKRTLLTSLLAVHLTAASAFASEPAQTNQTKSHKDLAKTENVKKAPVKKIPVKKAKSKTVDFQMLAINDFHGNLDTVGKFVDPKDGKELEVGGAAYLATHLNMAEQNMKEQSKEEGLKSYTLRVHAGDIVGASPPISALLQDEPTMAAINQMNFKVGVLGNHEFDEGIPELKRMLYATTVHPNVKEYTKGFNYHYKGIDKDFDYLAANVVDKNTG
ncbi:metallophosphoesterase [Bacillus xiapuensis]|uniref:Calcineurin-like phosphoesterase domain-containing protein n=1 Tax=Bacillus xiapuensis TaxID=2014075 RepID=A0ABU6NBT7_9BACI|nr:hypothetical protein [Bacillus xiapuensis]